jgi:hypothetical protein
MVAHKNGKKISNKMRKVLFATNILGPPRLHLMQALIPAMPMASALTPH